MFLPSPALFLILLLIVPANLEARWQAQRDTALDTRGWRNTNAKRLHRFALPAHSKGDQQSRPAAAIETNFDPAKDVTTVRLAPVQISGPKDKYHSLQLAASYSYPGRVPEKPQIVDFELKSIVKARKLKIDLYVVFVVDGETIFLSSSRSAIRNPVPGRRWVGERLVFRMPYEILLKITNSKQFAIKLDAVTFGVGEGPLEALREFADASSKKP